MRIPFPALQLGVIALPLMLVACRSSPEPGEALGSKTEALTAGSVLGLENPAEWTAGGLTLASSTDHTQGSTSLSIPAQSYTVVESSLIAIAPLSRGDARVDIRLPSPQQNPYWYGTLELALSAPSVGLYNAYEGQVSLQSLPPGTWRTVAFALTADTVGRLAHGAQDLTIRLILNVPANNGPYLLDNVEIGGQGAGTPATGGSGVPPEGGVPVVPPSDVAAVTLPKGYGPGDLALLAAGTLRLGNGARVSSDVGGHTAIANVGSGSTELGVDSVSDTVVSIPGVFAAERAAVAGELRHVGTLTPQNGVSIKNDVPRASIPTSSMSVDVPAPAAGTRQAVEVAPDVDRGTLEPGRYAGLHAYSRASLRLTAGSYAFDDVTLEPGSHLTLDDTSGPIYVRIARTFIMRGELRGVPAPDPRVLWIFDGEGSVPVEAPLRGSLYAPRALVKLATLAGTPTPEHRGAVLARDIQVDPNVRFVHVAFRWLTTTVAVAPTVACLGQPVTIHVATNAPAGTVRHFIDGVPGSTRVMQFDGRPGRRMVLVTTARDGTSETEQVKLEVRDCGAAAAIPMIGATVSLQGPARIQLVVRNPDAFGTGTTYFWQFGDGTSQRSSTPATLHDFSAALSPTEAQSRFAITVTAVRPDGTAATATTTVGLWNQYAISRAQGRLQPPTRAIVAPAAPGTDFSVEMGVDNPEQGSVRFTRRRAELQPCASSGSPLALAEATIDLDVPARQSAAYSFTVPASTATDQYCSLAVYLEGAGPDGLPAWASAHVVLPGREDTYKVTGAALAGILGRAVNEGWASDPGSITGEDLQRFVLENRISQQELEQAQAEAIGTAPLAKASATGPVTGARCKAGDSAAGYVCVPSGAWSSTQPSLLNARKGDVILSRSPGLISQMLAVVDPPQPFDHSGIMTEDYTELRHSVAAENRFVGYPSGGNSDLTDGFDSDVLKYGAPGTITQSVREAFRSGFYFKDTHAGAQCCRGYAFFSQPVASGLSSPLVYPYVVKPTPGWDNFVRPDGRTVRQALHDAADASRTINGHYRFYAYTQGDIVANPAKVAPTLHQDVWPQGDGSVPTVCSTMIWRAMKLANITLNTHVDPGEDVDAVAPDGMFHYTVQERKQGANFLYRAVYNQAEGALEGLVGDWEWVPKLFNDAPDDAANQVTNCFASDWCDVDAKDSSRWKDPGEGHTVSPSDIMFWDTPAEGGVLGHSEPLVYRDNEFVPDYAWQPASTAGTGQVNVEVYEYDGNVAAAVQVSAPSTAGVTDELGRATLTLPAQSQPIRAFAFRNGVGVEAHGNVTPVPGTTVTLTLRLPQAAPQERLVTIVGTHHVVDSELTFDEVATAPVFETTRLGPQHTTETIFFKTCRDEVRVEVTLRLTYDPATDSVTAAVEQNLYEAFGCDNHDHDGTSSTSVTVADHSSATLQNVVENTDEYAIGSSTDRGTLDVLIFVDPYVEVPQDLHRIDISGTLHLKDDETFGRDEIETVDVKGTVMLNENQRLQDWSFRECEGGEVVGVVTARFTLTQAGVVDVHTYYRLLEGTSCSTDEGENVKTDDFSLPVGSSHNEPADLDNNGDDEANFKLTFDHRLVH